MIGSATRLAAAALFTNVLCSSAMPASAAHLECKYTTVGHGRSSSMDIAMSRAVDDWRMQTANIHGPRYRHWHNSLSKGRKCDWKQGIAHCQVWANACR